MINLLPPRQRANIHQEKKWKMVSVLMISFFVFSFLLSGTLYLLKSFAFDFFDKEENLIFEKKPKLTGIQEKERKIESFNIIITQIDFFYGKTIDLTDVFKKIHNSLPSETYLESFQFNKREDLEMKKDIYQFILSGYSPDWRSLLEMEENFNNFFTKVEFSSGTWTQLKDINFLVNLEI